MWAAYALGCAWKGDALQPAPPLVRDWSHYRMLAWFVHPSHKKGARQATILHGSPSYTFTRTWHTAQGTVGSNSIWTLYGT